MADRPRKSAVSNVQQPELEELPETRTVLVVDDDTMMLRVFVRILQHENYTLLSADGGPEAAGDARSRTGLAFLEKPFTARALREAARLILFGAINPEIC